MEGESCLHIACFKLFEWAGAHGAGLCKDGAVLRANCRDSLSQVSGEIVADAGPVQSTRRLLLLFSLKNGPDFIPISLHSSQGCNLSGLLLNGVLSCGSCGFALEIVTLGAVQLKFRGWFKVACFF